MGDNKKKKSIEPGFPATIDFLELRLYELLHVLVHHFGQLKHRDLGLSEQWFQFVVSIDIATVLFVLQIVLLDIIPDFLNDLSSWQRFRTDHSS